MKKLNLSKINAITLSLFGAVLSSGKAYTRDLAVEQKLFSDYNVVVFPNAHYALKEIASFVKSNKKTAKELNSTFYRSWNDVISKTHFELLIDQILHYASTYGTNFEGEAYVPASYFELELSEEESKLPVSFIVGLSEQELVEKIVMLLESGVALKQETVEDLLYVLDALSALEANADRIKNKEAKTVVAEKYGITRILNQNDFMRFLVYKATNETLLIKNANVLNLIKLSRWDISDLLVSYGLKTLAQSFNRYKPFYLAFKKANGKNASAINKIAKLSKVHHKPLAEHPLNRVSKDVFNSEDIAVIENSSIPLLLRGYNAALLSSVYKEHSMFVVRNGRSWVSEEKNKLNKASLKTAKVNAGILKDILIEKLGENFKGKEFYIPSEIEYGLPLSEKQMCGNIPNNTIISTTKTLCVGAFWDRGYGVDDIDLSGLSTDGNKYGWDGDRYSRDKKKIIYSGDMTSVGPNGAVEYLTVSPHEENETEIINVTINSYRGGSTYKYDIVVGVTSDDDIHIGAMMKPKDLLFSGQREAKKRGGSLGNIIIKDGVSKFVFAPSDQSSFRVSDEVNARKEATDVAVLHKLENSLTLNKLIILLGGTIVNELTDSAVDLSPAKINKDFFNVILG